MSSHVHGGNGVQAAVLLSPALLSPAIPAQHAAAPPQLECFLHILSHLLLGIVVLVTLDECDQTQRFMSLWDFSITINLKHI